MYSSELPNSQATMIRKSECPNLRHSARGALAHTCFYFYDVLSTTYVVYALFHRYVPESMHIFPETIQVFCWSHTYVLQNSHIFLHTSWTFLQNHAYFSKTHASFSRTHRYVSAMCIILILFKHCLHYLHVLSIICNLCNIKVLLARFNIICNVYALFCTF